MNSIGYIILIILILYIVFRYINKNYEAFTVYEVNYNTNITPWVNGPQEYRRCICSGIEDCKCLSDFELDDIYNFPSCYMNQYERPNIDLSPNIIISQ